MKDWFSRQNIVTTDIHVWKFRQNGSLLSLPEIPAFVTLGNQNSATTEVSAESLVQRNYQSETENSSTTVVPVQIKVQASVEKNDQPEAQLSTKKVSFNEKVTQHVIEPVSVEIGKWNKGTRQNNCFQGQSENETEKPKLRTFFGDSTKGKFCSSILNFRQCWYNVSSR